MWHEPCRVIAEHVNSHSVTGGLFVRFPYSLNIKKPNNIILEDIY